MPGIQSFLKELQRGNPNVTKDANPNTADATQRAPVYRTQIDAQELWTIIFPSSILLSIGLTPWLIKMFFSLGLGGWILEGIDAFLGSLIFFYLFVHPFLVILCSIISWYLHNKNKHAKAIVWTIIPIAGFMIVLGLYYIISTQHPGWG